MICRLRIIKRILWDSHIGKPSGILCKFRLFWDLEQRESPKLNLCSNLINYTKYTKYPSAYSEFKKPKYPKVSKVSSQEIDSMKNHYNYIKPTRIAHSVTNVTEGNKI